MRHSAFFLGAALLLGCVHSFELTTTPEVWRRTSSEYRECAADTEHGVVDPLVVIDGVETDPQHRQVLTAWTERGVEEASVADAPLALALGSYREDDALVRFLIAQPDDSEETELALVIAGGGGGIVALSAVLALLLAPVPPVEEPAPAVWVFGIGAPIGGALAVAGLLAAIVSTYLFGERLVDRELEGPAPCPVLVDSPVSVIRAGS